MNVRVISLAGNIAQCEGNPDGSAASTPVNDGCAPGFVPPGCDTTRRLTGTIGAGLSIDIELGAYQSLQPVAMVNVGSGPSITLDRIEINGKDQKTGFKADTNPAFLVSGFGFVTGFTAALIEAGANWFPISWNTDQNNQLKLTFTNTGVGAETLDVFVYFANPGNPAMYARKNSS